MSSFIVSRGFSFFSEIDSPTEGDEIQPDAAIPILGIDSLEDRAGTDDVDLDDPAREETASMPPSEPPNQNTQCIPVAVCLRTSLPFQTSPAMKLLPSYDDGLNPSVAMMPWNTEPVFCRICREGLHEDADDEQPAKRKRGKSNGKEEQPSAAENWLSILGASHNTCLI